MPDFKRIPGKAAYSGMDLHHPPDLMPEGKCSLMFNLQPDIQNGSVSVRPPIGLLATTPATIPVHSAVRMNDSVPEATQPFSRFAGAGTHLYYGPGGSLANLDSGYSGNPVAMVPYRPSQSPESWLYVYDSLKQQRYKTDGTTQNIGIAAPTQAPGIARTRPLYKLLTDTESAANWSDINPIGGTVSTPTAVAKVPASSTAPIILYDVGSSGSMACISAASSNFGWMTSGASVIVDGEQTYIEEIFPAVGATTIAAIAYDTGSTGLCTIVLAAALPGLRRNQLLILNSAVNVRVLAVTAAPDSTYSLRCSTASSTVAVSQTVTSPPNFRTWLASAHSGGSALTGNAITATLTPTVSGGEMSAIMFGFPATYPLNLDATQISGRPLGNEDYMHIGISFDHPEWVTEVHFMLDIDLAGAAFTNNFFYYVVEQSAFQQSAINGGTSGSPGATPILTAQLDAIQAGVAADLVGSVLPSAEQPPYPTPQNPSYSQPSAPQNINTGQFSWTDVMFKYSDMTRVGTDTTLGLQSVNNGLGILIYTNGGVVNAFVSGWWVGGGYGPDCNFNSSGNQAPPIQWRYRYRNSLTGAKSTVSPEVINGEILRRQAVNLTAANSPDSQVDTLDWERRGGTNPDWHYVASVPSGTTFLDGVTESVAQISDALEVTTYQPWPVTDVPHQGTATVVGTSVVWASGDTFNLRWLRGTEVIIGGNTYSLYEPPLSSTRLQLAQSVPAPGTYPFSIPEATIEGQPCYGAWLDKGSNRILTVGDQLNPGIVYFTNNDNPDGASDSGYLEVTSPDETLLNGFYAEGTNWVFSATNLYRMDSSTGVNQYVAYRVSGVEGVAGPWAFDASRKLLFYWGPDGIYMYAFGTAAENLTANDLYPLFPHAGQPGQQGIPGVPVSIAGKTIYPPNYAQTSLLRIAYAESFVFATYQNSAGAYEALVYSLGAKGWRKDTYSPAATLFTLERGVTNPALMVGGVDGNLYEVAANNANSVDAGGPIAYVLLPPARDAGDSRALKQWGDLMVDYSGLPTAQVLWDNLLVSGPSAVLPPSGNRSQTVFDLIVPPNLYDTNLLHLNIAVMYTGNGLFSLYEWQPSCLPLPETTTSRVSTWQTGFSVGFKWINGVVIHGNTYGLPKQFYVEYDNAAVSEVITVTLNGEQRLPFYFPPIYAHQVRLVPLDDTPWFQFEDEAWIGNDEPEYGGALAVNWVNGGTPHYKFVQGFRLHADTFGQPKQIQIQYDGGIVGPTLTINHNGEQTIPYSWNPPFKAHLMRIIPLDSVPWRYWADTEWVYELEPEPANYWISQPTALGQAGYMHARELWMAFAGTTAGGVISAIVDGVLTTIAILPAAASPQKTYFPVPPLKGRYWQITASGTGLQLYERDIEFLVKSWGSTGPYQRLRPFGDASGGGGTSGAKI